MEPQIYVADLAAYNNGVLHGRWIDAAQDEDEIREEIAEMLRNSPYPNAEEWAVHDYEDMPPRLGEYPALAEIAEIARGIKEHGEPFLAWVEYFYYHEYWSDGFEEAYEGEWDDLEDYARDFVDGVYGTDSLPKWVRWYIDYESMARDWRLGGDIWTADAPGGRVFVFRNI